jgi:hypothetical protein
MNMKLDYTRLDIIFLRQGFYSDKGFCPYDFTIEFPSHVNYCEGIAASGYGATKRYIRWKENRKKQDSYSSIMIGMAFSSSVGELPIL